MTLQITAAAGLFGALLMFSGDMLLYFTADSYEMDGTLTPYIGIMEKLPNWRLKLGGLLGPVAAFFYCIGYYHITLAAADDFKGLAFAATLISSLGIIVGGAYHSHFTYFGLLGKTDNQAGIEEVIKNTGMLSRISISLIAIGAVILGGLVVFGKTYYPNWFIVLTPMVTYFLGFIMVKLPQPFRVVLFGGWYNLIYVIFFLASLILSWGI